MLEKYCNDKHYTLNAPLAEIYDFSVFEYAFAFWQWGSDIQKIPTREADDLAVFKYWISHCEPDYFSNQNPYFSFDVQAAKELGYYGYYTKPFKRYLSIKTAKGYFASVDVAEGCRGSEIFSWYHMSTEQDFLSKNDPKMVYIYGSIDPWSASGIYGLPFTKNKQNLHVYMCPGGSHLDPNSFLPRANPSGNY